MQRFQFKNETLDSDDERLEAALAAAHAAKLRPLCPCTSPAAPMYVAHVGEHYVIKRMPNSGHQHDPDCPSYDPPAELSGLGEVAGSAIVEDVASGVTSLKFDFTLSKAAARVQPGSSGSPPDTLRTDGAKLTLRGTLHYLWDQAHLNRWAPAMMGKRSWFIVRRELLAAAGNKVNKGEPLGSVLFIPETYSVDRKEEIHRHRRENLLRLSASKGVRKLMVMVGEVKQFESARYGFKAVVKHLPEMPLLVAEDLHRRLVKRFATEFAIWEADESTHLVMIATFGIDEAGFARVEEASLVITSSNWIPIENRWELELVDVLSRGGRRFTKGLRYNMPGDRPIACAVLSDTKPRPIALYVVPGNATPEFETALDDLVEGSDLEAWIWRAADEDLPSIPWRSGEAPRPATRALEPQNLEHESTAPDEPDDLPAFHDDELPYPNE